jgi:D-cysteine desulfhydrase family pyridoxal phosphate-dependent enzyme
MHADPLVQDWTLVPRYPLAYLPTPLVAAPRLSAHLDGPRILFKRDDLTGLAFGGNKVRKLEFLLGEALAQGCDTVITGGAQQSNHSRQTAAAAAAAGLRCHLALAGEPPPHAEGNLLIDLLCGAALHFCGEHRKGEDIPEIAADLTRQGRQVYEIPYGGSNATGALGFIQAAQELALQLREMGESARHVIFASSSGGTHAGLAQGLAWFAPETKPLGIGIDKEEGPPENFCAQVVEIARAAAKRLARNSGLRPKDIEYCADFHGAGYGVIGEAEREAVRLVAETEGILLDPVYTGRAMAGLVAKIRAGEFESSQSVVFWHTGGQPALFARARELT